jgi:hypothetical protein
MAIRMNLQKTAITVEDMLSTEIIVNLALIDILIAKQIISEEELMDYIGKIRLEQKERSRECPH